MVQTAEADVVCPAVTAQNPYRLLNQVVGQFGQGLGFSCVDAGQLVAQSFDIGALVVDFDVGRLRIAQNLVCQFADFVL